jgi:hypothetical protein
MYLALCGIIVGLVLAVASIALLRARKKKTLSSDHRQQLGFAMVCSVMGVLLPLAIIIPDIFDGDHSMSAPEAVYEHARTTGQFTDAQMSHISAGVRKAHAEYWGSSGHEVVFLLYPLVFTVLGAAHFFFALTPEKKADPVGTDNDRAVPGRV